MTTFGTILGTTLILSLCLAYVTRSQTQSAQAAAGQASLEFARTSSATTELFQTTLLALKDQADSMAKNSQEDRRMLMAFLEASRDQAREYRESVQAMMEATSSTVSEIVSPPQPPLSPVEQAMAEALAKDPWEGMQTSAEQRENQEAQRLAQAPLGWAVGPVDPFADGNLPEDTPGPIEGTAEMPGAFLYEGIL